MQENASFKCSEPRSLKRQSNDAHLHFIGILEQSLEILKPCIVKHHYLDTADKKLPEATSYNAYFRKSVPAPHYGGSGGSGGNYRRSRESSKSTELFQCLKLQLLSITTDIGISHHPPRHQATLTPIHSTAKLNQSTHFIFQTITVRSCLHFTASLKTHTASETSSKVFGKSLSKENAI